MTMTKKVLDWKPIPERAHKLDVYAERAGMRWTIKRAAEHRTQSYVLRLNGAVIRRCETWREAKNKAEMYALEREEVR